MSLSKNRSRPSSYASPTSSPTSSAPSYALPPTPTTRYSSTFLDVAKRQSEKKAIPSALANARLSLAGKRYSFPVDCLRGSSPLTSEPYGFFPASPSPKSLKPTTTSPTSGPLSRLRSRFPSVRRAQPTKVVAEASQSSSSFAIHRPQKNESRCLQFIMPGLYIAFEDDQVAFGGSEMEDEELRTHDGQRFTHLIRLVKLTSASHPPSIKHTVDRYKTKRLTLSIFSHSHITSEMRMRILSSFHVDGDDLLPEVAQAFYSACGSIKDPSEGVTLLTVKQLLASRNFLYATGYDLQNRNEARILITAPRDHRTDVISVLTCYLAYTSRNLAQTILREIDKHESILGVWKRVVSREGAEVIQEIVSDR